MKYYNNVSIVYLERVLEDGAEAVYENLKYGLPIPSYVPQTIKWRGELLFEKRMNSYPIEYAGATRNKSGLKKRRLLDGMIEDFNKYNKSGWNPPASMYIDPAEDEKKENPFFKLGIHIIIAFLVYKTAKKLVSFLLFGFLRLIK